MSTLKDRIAALQANSGGPTPQNPSNVSSRSSSPGLTPPASASEPPEGKANRLISRFNKMGNAPAPRGSFGLGAPPVPEASLNLGKKEFFGNRADVHADGATIGRSASQGSTGSRPRSSLERHLAASESESRPFELRPQKPRSPSAQSAFAVGSPRTSYLTPHYTGDGKGALSSTSNVPPVPNFPYDVIPNRRRASSPLASNEALTADSLAKLPTSPSFRPDTITSSIGTDLDGRSVMALNTPSDTRARFSMTGSAITEDPLSYSTSHGRSSNAPTVSSSKSSFRDDSSSEGQNDRLRRRLSTESGAPGPRPSTPSYYAQLNESAAALGAPDQPRPSTPSYLTQAANYFPPSKRQSILIDQLPADFLRSAPSSPTDGDKTVNGSSVGDELTKVPKGPLSHSRESDSLLGHNGLSPTKEATQIAVSRSQDATTSERRGKGSLSISSPIARFGGGGGEGSTKAASRLSVAQGDGTSSARNSLLIPNSPGAMTPLPSAVLGAFPTPPESSASSQTPIARTTLPPSRATTTPGASAATVAKRKKPKLVPGKWINSDDEDSDDGEDKGWAKIIVSSTTR